MFYDIIILDNQKDFVYINTQKIYNKYMENIKENSIISLGSDIKKLRIEANITQEQLSKLCNIDRAHLSKIESGDVQGVTYSTVEKIFNALGRKLTHIKSDVDAVEYFDVHPFVKWAGGKTQLLDKIIAHLPQKYNDYYEPFVGEGALFLKLQPSNIIINDMNSELICAYQSFFSVETFDLLKKCLEQHEKNNSEEYYYTVREQDHYDSYNTLPIYQRAARMIYLNKACFNGLYRVNSKGYFNVPFGKKETVNCFDRKNFENLRKYFCNKNVKVLNEDYEKAVKEAKKGDFVYFDPPHDTLEKKNNFTSYDKNVFGKEEQARLAKVYKELDERGVYVMLSNHNTEYIRELYKDFTINIVEARRNINSDAKGRGNVEEVIITNYE